MIRRPWTVASDDEGRATSHRAISLDTRGRVAGSAGEASHERPVQETVWAGAANAGNGAVASNPSGGLARPPSAASTPTGPRRSSDMLCPEGSARNSRLAATTRARFRELSACQLAGSLSQAARPLIGAGLKQDAPEPRRRELSRILIATRPVRKPAHIRRSRTPRRAQDQRSAELAAVRRQQRTGVVKGRFVVRRTSRPRIS